MRETDAVVVRIPLTHTIRPARSHVVADGAQLAAVNREGGVVVGEDSGDAAH